MGKIAGRPNIPKYQLDLYDKLVATILKIERKGVTIPYTYVNGHMFTFLSNSGTLAIRLPEKEREEFLSKHKTNLMVANGVIMKEYVAVPDSLLKKTKEIELYLKMSFDYVKTLKPKATKKKR